MNNLICSSSEMQGLHQTTSIPDGTFRGKLCLSDARSHNDGKYLQSMYYLIW
jgi:hypothetical protein